MNRKLDIGNNIRLLREHYGFTQKQLAEKINYTEKSVSKWENNDGIPTLDVLIKLCSLFQVSVDELIYQKINKMYLLGIDGGGTKTAFRLTDTSGNIIKTVYKSSSNPNDVGLENTKEVLDQGIREVCQGIPFRNITMFAGLSGGGLTGNYRELLHDFFVQYGFCCFDNGSDVDNLISLAQHPQCILVIMGTGCIGYGLDGDKRCRIGGWGYHFENGGSGYSIGRDVISAVLSACDGSGKQSLLTKLLEDRLGESAEKHLSQFYTGGKQYIAGFSDLVFIALSQGDEVASKILDRNMRAVAAMINAAYQQFSIRVPVLFFGGISSKFEVLFPLIRKYLNDPDISLKYMSNDPVDGAVSQAGQLLRNKES